MADTPDLGSGAARRGGSSPPSRSYLLPGCESGGSSGESFFESGLIPLPEELQRRTLKGELGESEANLVPHFERERLVSARRRFAACVFCGRRARLGWQTAAAPL